MSIEGSEIPINEILNCVVDLYEMKKTRRMELISKYLYKLYSFYIRYNYIK